MADQQPLPMLLQQWATCCVHRPSYSPHITRNAPQKGISTNALLCGLGDSMLLRLYLTQANANTTFSRHNCRTSRYVSNTSDGFGLQPHPSCMLTAAASKGLPHHKIQTTSTDSTWRRGAHTTADAHTQLRKGGSCARVH